MSISNSIKFFIVGEKYISRVSFLWRTLFFTLSIPETINLLLPNAMDTLGSQPFFIILLISISMLVSVTGSICAFIGRLNDLRMSTAWLLLIIFVPGIPLLWLYLLVKPSAKLQEQILPQPVL